MSEPATEPPRQIGYRELFAGNRNFRHLFAARAVSFFGDWFNLLALLALLRDIGAESASAFAGVLILKTLPTVVAAPFAGVLADRVSRKAILIASDAGRALIVLCMLSVGWFPSVPLLYALVIAQTLTAAFFEPARTALLPDILRPGELVAANAVGAALWSTMLALGSAAGGLLTAWLGWEAAILVDAASYLLSLALLASIEEPVWQRAATGTGSALAVATRQVTDGLRWLAHRPRVLSLTLVKSAWSVAGPSTLVLTVLAERVFSVGGETMIAVTILYVARGIGTGAGPFLALALSRGEPAAMERMIAFGFAVGTVFYLLLGHASTIWLTAAGVIIAHFGGATVWVFSTVRLQQVTPSHVRGRVFAFENAAFTVAIGVTTWAFGMVLDLPDTNVRWVASAMGVLLALSTGAWLLRGAVWGWASRVVEP